MKFHVLPLTCGMKWLFNCTVQPLRYLIQFSKNDPTDMTWREDWKGYVLAAGFFLTVMLQSFFFHQLFFWGVGVGLRIRACLVSAVYKKVGRYGLVKGDEIRQSLLILLALTLLHKENIRYRVLFSLLKVLGNLCKKERFFM